MGVLDTKMEPLRFHHEAHKLNLIKIPLVRGSTFIILDQRHVKSTAIASISITSGQ